jgi:phosphate-selective porin
MKLKLALAAAVLMSAPAFAQGAAASDTVAAIISKGVSIEISGFAGTVDYKADGTFSGFDGMFEGTYKVDGNKICSESALGASCAEYPDGKKSGDTFELPSEMGPMKVTIR